MAGDDDGGGGAIETEGMAHNYAIPHTSHTLKERQELHHGRTKEEREKETRKKHTQMWNIGGFFFLLLSFLFSKLYKMMKLNFFSNVIRSSFVMLSASTTTLSIECLWSSMCRHSHTNTCYKCIFTSTTKIYRTNKPKM